MRANEYQEATAKTEIYTEAAENFLSVSTIDEGEVSRTFLSIMYCAGKLNGEAGEVAEKVFKCFRDNQGYMSGNFKYELAKELGDVAWYLSRLADLIGYPLEDIFIMNLEKLEDRKVRGVLSGEGDNR